MFPRSVEHIKKAVEAMESAADVHDADVMVSPIWQKILDTYGYIKELGPESLKQIRLHGGRPISMDSAPYGYWFAYPEHNPEAFAQGSGYLFHSQGLPEDLVIGEPEIPGLPAYGIVYRDRIINQDIARYQGVLANLHATGILRKLRNGPRPVILEIGPGYGGLAHQIYNALDGRATMILLDLPRLFMFSATFAALNNPGAKLFFHNPDDFDRQSFVSDVENLDFCFFPLWALEALEGLPRLDLALNCYSFQEMPVKTIQAYLAFLKRNNTSYVYSENRERHAQNLELRDKRLSDFFAQEFIMSPPPALYDRFISNDQNRLYKKVFIMNSRDSDAVGTPLGPIKLFLSAEESFEFTKDNRDWSIRRSGAE